MNPAPDPAAPPAAGARAPGAPLLRVDAVVREFGGVRALGGVSLSVGAGELVCVIGPNGCGKTTLFNIVTAQLPPTSGRVLFEGRVLAGLAPHQVARLGIARKFQVPSVFEDLTVADNLGVAAYPLRHRPAGLPPVAAPTPGRVLEQVQLQAQAHLPAGQLSHGQRQWLEIGMLLAQAPRLMLLDEPTAGMTGAETLATAALVQRLARETGTAVVVVEHDMRFVEALQARVVVMLAGRVAAEGSYDEVRRLPAVREAYLGAHA